MAAMPELKSPVATAIEAHYFQKQQFRDGGSISPTMLGNGCERAIWYSFRWASPIKPFDGRMLRLFETGNREETRMIANLRAIGVDVLERDPKTGRQWEITLANGLIHGFADGRALNVPGAELTEHLVECKTHNDKSFQEFRRKGVEAAKPDHYIQMQIYMGGLGLTRALYIAHNKNTDEIETERVKFDAHFVAQLTVKAERIGYSDHAPVRFETFSCRYCNHLGVCGRGEFARVNCRTCLYAALGNDAQWRCGKNGAVLSYDEQQRGCKAHLYLPDLVPGEQIDSDDERGIVTYELYEFSNRARGYVDGADPKPNVPRVAP